MRSLLSFRRRGESVQKAGSDLAMQHVLNVKRTSRFPSLAQWWHLPRFLSSRERKIAFAAGFTAVAALVALGGQFLLTHVERAPATGGEYTEGIVGYPHYINPLYSYASDVDAALARLTFSGLMRQDPKEGLVPDLAESYTISTDERSYTFKLRDGLTWQDGEPVTGNDVVFTYTAMQNPEYGSPLAASLAGIVVNADDEHTVTFTLPEAFAPFLSTATVGILPSHVWENVPAANAQLTQLNLKPIGNGPYMFDKLVKDSRGTLRSITFVRNPNYHRGAPHVARITFKFFTDNTELTTALRNHAVEGTAALSASELAPFANDHAFSVNEPLSRQFVGAFFNLKSTSPVNDVEVRKALVSATDRAALIAALPAHSGQPMAGPVMSGLPGYDASRVIPGSDIVAATTTLENKGWKIPEGGGTRTKDGKTLTFTITTLDIPEFVTVARALADQWNAVGAQATVVEVDGTAFEGTVLKNRSYDVLVAGEQYGIFPDPYPFWHSSQAPYPGLNVSQLISRAADDSISTIRSTADVNARATSFVALGTTLEDTAVAAFLYQSISPIALPGGLKNVNLPVLTTPADRFANVQDWYLKTKPILKKKSDSGEVTN